MSSYRYGTALPLAFIAAIGLVTALISGIWIAGEDYIKIGLLVLFVVGTWVLSITRRYLLYMCFSLAIFNFYVAPFGFKTLPVEQTFGLVLLIWLSVIWKKEYYEKRDSLFGNISAYHLYTIFVLIGTFYAIIHFLFNFKFPYELGAFGWQGASKTYIAVFGLFTMTVLIFNTNLIPKITKDKSYILLKIFASCYYLLLLIKVYSILKFGAEEIQSSTLEEKEELARTFFIPIINVWDSFFTLRNLGPIAGLIGATFYFCSRYLSARYYGLLLIGGGLIGSVIAGGRATLFFCIGLIILAIFHARKTAYFLSGSAILILGIIVIFALPAKEIESFPWHIQRSLALFRPDVKTRATLGAQQGLNDIRVFWFKNALAYWASGDLRLILTGRSVTSMTSEDVQSFILNNEKDVVMFGIRRLATHNGITDMLVGFGLIGYLLILAISISCLLMLNSYQKKFERGSYGDCWLEIAKGTFAFWLGYTHLGGNFVWTIAIWLIVIGMLQLDGLKEPSHTDRLKVNHKL